jgi:hypothetical protein
VSEELTTLEERRLVRRYCRVNKHDAIAVYITNQYMSPPKLVGSSYYWTTMSGKTIIRHPNAYHWPKLYHGSTRCIEVSREWLFLAKFMMISEHNVSLNEQIS